MLQHSRATTKPNRITLGFAPCRTKYANNKDNVEQACSDGSGNCEGQAGLGVGTSSYRAEWDIFSVDRGFFLGEG